MDPASAPPPGSAAVVTAAADVVEGLFDAAPMALALVDRSLRVVRANRELQRLAGAGEATLRGRSAAEVLPEVFGERFGAAAEAVLAGGTPPPFDVEIGAPGRRTQLVVSCFPVRAGEAVAAFGAALADVTEARRREELQTRMIAVASHDLRTPLAAVSVSAQALLRSKRLGEPEARLLRAIRGSVRRMEAIVRDLLDYAVVRRYGGMPLAPAEADVGRICREVAAECEAAAPGRVVSCAGGGLRLWCDGARLAQAVSNLVSNALKYGDPAAPVEVTWAVEGDRVRLDVRNSGAPIPADVLPGLFEPFRRGPGERGSGGLGLGLFIAREIAAAHGGRLDARSDAAGTVFSVELPLRTAEVSGA